MLDLKTLRRPAWSSWEIKGSLYVVEMGKEPWLLEFDSIKEAEGILKDDTRRTWRSCLNSDGLESGRSGMVKPSLRSLRCL